MTKQSKIVSTCGEVIEPMFTILFKHINLISIFNLKESVFLRVNND